MKLPDSELLNLSSSPLKVNPIHTRPLNKVDHLIAQVGIGIVDTVERSYRKYKSKPNESNAKTYCLWRLRLHRRLKNDKILLEEINEARELGLFDEQPGKTCWELTFG